MAETLEEFLQKEWNALCKKKRVEKPYPPINPENREFAKRLAAFVVREIVPEDRDYRHDHERGMNEYNDKTSGWNDAVLEMKGRIKALGIPVEGKA